MNWQGAHRVLTVFLLGAMLMSAMGYTAAVRHCSMSQSSDCCCEPSPLSHGAAGPRQFSLTGEAPWCNTVTILGGVHDIPVTFSWASSSLPHLVEAALPFVDPVTQGLSAVRPVGWPYEDPAPPGVEICIRTDSLLI